MTYDNDTAQYSMNNDSTSRFKKGLRALEIWYFHLISHENKNLILSSILFLLFSVISTGIFFSKKRENSAVASYRTSQLVHDIYRSSSDISSSTLEELQLLAKSYSSSFEKSSALLALDAIAKGAYEGNLLKNSFDSSRKYFTIQQMNPWIEFINAVENKEVRSEENLSSRRIDFLRFYSSFFSLDSSPEEKIKIAKMFFEKYPEFTSQLELAWGEKIQKLYEFLENQYNS